MLQQRNVKLIIKGIDSPDVDIETVRCEGGIFLIPVTYEIGVADQEGAHLFEAVFYSTDLAVEQIKKDNFLHVQSGFIVERFSKEIALDAATQMIAKLEVSSAEAMLRDLDMYLKWEFRTYKADQ